MCVIDENCDTEKEVKRSWEREERVELKHKIAADFENVSKLQSELDL